jgi:hypothetical protein
MDPAERTRSIFGHQRAHVKSEEESTRNSHWMAQYLLLVPISPTLLPPSSTNPLLIVFTHEIPGFFRFVVRIISVYGFFAEAVRISAASFVLVDDQNDRVPKQEVRTATGRRACTFCAIQRFLFSFVV